MNPNYASQTKKAARVTDLKNVTRHIQAAVGAPPIPLYVDYTRTQTSFACCRWLDKQNPKPAAIYIAPHALRRKATVLAFVLAHEIAHSLHQEHAINVIERGRTLKDEISADIEAAAILRVADIDLPRWQDIRSALRTDDDLKVRQVHWQKTLAGRIPKEEK